MQTFMKQYGMQYSIDDISEIIFQWMPKNATGMTNKELKEFFEHL